MFAQGRRRTSGGFLSSFACQFQEQQYAKGKKEQQFALHFSLLYNLIMGKCCFHRRWALSLSCNPNSSSCLILLKVKPTKVQQRRELKVCNLVSLLLENSESGSHNWKSSSFGNFIRKIILARSMTVMSECWKCNTLRERGGEQDEIKLWTLNIIPKIRTNTMLKLSRECYLKVFNIK